MSHGSISAHVVQEFLGPEASDQLTALAGDAATIATVGAGRDSVQGPGGAATGSAVRDAGSASSAAAKGGALSTRAKVQAAIAQPLKAVADVANAGTDADLPEVEEAENPDSIAGGVDQLDPSMRGIKKDLAGDAVSSAFQAAGTKGDYGDELIAGRTSE